MQEEQRAYNNREHCRDQFYAIIREAASAYSAFGWNSTGAESDGYLKMKDSVRNFLQVLLVENYPWFAGKIQFLSYFCYSFDDAILSKTLVAMYAKGGSSFGQYRLPFVVIHCPMCCIVEDVELQAL